MWKLVASSRRRPKPRQFWGWLCFAETTDRVFLNESLTVLKESMMHIKTGIKKLSVTWMIPVVLLVCAPLTVNAAGKTSTTRGGQTHTIEKAVKKLTLQRGTERETATVSCSSPPYFASVCPSVLKASCKKYGGTMSENNGKYTCTLWLAFVISFRSQAPSMTFANTKPDLLPRPIIPAILVNWLWVFQMT